MFERLLVQAAKPRLLEAETLAGNESDQEIVLTIRHKKLFLRFDQMYSNQVHWVRDALEHGLYLASNDSLASKRESFGKNVFILSNRIEGGPMHTTATKISSYGERWNQNPFLFSLLALFIASRQHRLGFAVLAQVENYLRSSHNRLLEADFH
jgi:hypothetical protein